MININKAKYKADVVWLHVFEEEVHKEEQNGAGVRVERTAAVVRRGVGEQGVGGAHQAHRQRFCEIP